jgi:hypothetical protein
VLKANVGVSAVALVYHTISQYPLRVVLGGTIGNTSVLVVKVPNDAEVTVPAPVITVVL